MKPKIVISSLIVVFLLYALYAFFNTPGKPPHVHSRDDTPGAVDPPPADKVERAEELKQQLQEQPDNFDLLMALGHAYLESKDFRSAQEVFQRAVEINPSAAEAQTDLAIVLKRNGFVDRALVQLQKVTKEFPDYGEGWLQLGVIYRFDKKENEKALESFQKFIKLERNSELIPRVQEEIQKIQVELNR